MLDEWRKSILVLICKKKWYFLSYTKYRETINESYNEYIGKSNWMKIKLKQKILDIQFGFVQEATIEAIYMLRWLMEK